MRHALDHARPAPGRALGRAPGRALDRLARDDAGLSTAEYAVGTVAVAGLGGLLIKLLTSDEVRGLLWQVIQKAYSLVLGG